MRVWNQERSVCTVCTVYDRCLVTLLVGHPRSKSDYTNVDWSHSPALLCVFAGIMKALKCPFLTRIPVGQVRQHATELLSIADRCPIMGHVIKHSTAATTTTNSSATGESSVSYSAEGTTIHVLAVWVLKCRGTSFLATLILIWNLKHHWMIPLHLIIYLWGIKYAEFFLGAIFWLTVDGI